MNTIATLKVDGSAFTAVSDFRNEKRTRNQRNTANRFFNCGGYALETYNWFVPYFTSSAIDNDVFDEIVYGNDYGDIDDWDYDWESIPCAEDDELYQYIKADIKEEFFLIRDERLAECEAWESENLILSDSEPDKINEIWNNVFYNSCYDHPAALLLAVKLMLKAFPDMRLVHSFEELRNDEYGVSYAAGGGDFHFCKYNNGVYTAKNGAQPIHKVADEDAAFGDRYDSEIFRFAKKISKVH